MKKSTMTRLFGLGLAAASLAAAPAQAADYARDFQGVRFEIQVLDADSLRLTMFDTNAASGDWTGVTALNAFMIDYAGSGFTTASATGPGGFVYSDLNLNQNGCAGFGSSKNMCFAGFVGVASVLSWEIDVTGGVLDLPFPNLGPQLTVRFGNEREDSVGTLFSKHLHPVPEPETYALMLAGLAVVGFVARRRKAA